MEIISWILFVLFIAGLLTIGGVLLRGYLTGEASSSLLSSGLFAPKPPQKRLDVVDQTTIDGRRRLILIRRDNVEHLIMTGGPVDVVIETSIASTGKTVRPEQLRSTTSQTAPPSKNEESRLVSNKNLDKAVGD